MGLCCAEATRATDRIYFAFTSPMRFPSPMTRALTKLLGPCFKTGRIGGQRFDAEYKPHENHPSSTNTEANPYTLRYSENAAHRHQRGTRRTRLCAATRRPIHCNCHGLVTAQGGPRTERSRGGPSVSAHTSSESVPKGTPTTHAPPREEATHAMAPKSTEHRR